MASKKKKEIKKNSHKNRAITMLLFASLFFVILISTVISDWIQIRDNKRETEQLLKKKEELLEEEASLKSEVNKLKDPDYIARYAREKYMYTKDGEVILKIVEDDKEIKE